MRVPRTPQTELSSCRSLCLCVWCVARVGIAKPQVVSTAIPSTTSIVCAPSAHVSSFAILSEPVVGVRVTSTKRRGYSRVERLPQPGLTIWALALPLWGYNPFEAHMAAKALPAALPISIE